MKTNIGMTDRVVRMLLGVTIASVAITFYSPWALIGIPVFVSGIIGIDPLYTLLKFNTFGDADNEMS